MTESVVALPHGTAGGRSDSPRASARARVKGSVTHREQKRSVGQARPVRFARQVGRVMYRDAADSWIVRESTPSIRQVWSTDYAALASVDWAPFRVWCRFWRYPAVFFASATDGAKFFLIHPVRGPLFIGAVAGGTVAAVWG